MDVKEAIKDTISGKAEYVSKDEKKRRLAICESCNEFKKLTRRCGVCGCFMDVKAIFVKSTCAADKPRW